MRKHRIAIVGIQSIGGGANQTNAICKFLSDLGYPVKLVYYDGVPFRLRILRQISAICGLHAVKSKESQLDYIERSLRKYRPDVVIAVESGDILLRDVGKSKIYFCHAPAAHEVYYSLTYPYESYPHYTWRDLEEARARQQAAFKKSDFVLIAWGSYEAYIKKHVYNGGNIVSNSNGGWFGCSPQSRTCYKSQPSAVFLGSLERYFNNMELLSYISKKIPYPLHVYGAPRPNPRWGLNYKGISSPEVLRNYQFGINTVTKDPLRRSGFSSKILTYLSYGLPTLFPEWEEFPWKLKGCVPYNEDNISEILQKYSQRELWIKTSNEAYAQANELHWNKVLTPIMQILES